MKRKMLNNSQVESFVEKRKEGPPLRLRPELRVVREVSGRNDFEADVGITEAVVGARMKLKNENQRVRASNSGPRFAINLGACAIQKTAFCGSLKCF